MLIENCHQGAYAPGMRQWQGFLKNATAPGGFLFSWDTTLVPQGC